MVAPPVQPTDLWDAFGNASGIAGLSGYMLGYTSQVGYPLVTLAWADPGSATTGVGALVVSQARHLYSQYSIDRTPAVRRPAT